MHVGRLWHGCDVDHWPQQAAEQSLKVETELAERFASPEEQRTERAQQFSVDEITKLCPALHLKRFINAMAGTYHSQADTIVNKITIMIRNSPYFESLDKYLAKANLDDLKAYLLFRLGFVLGADMDAKMEDMGFLLQRIITGQVKKVPRWKKCMHACINALPDDVGKIFVHHFFSSATKQHGGSARVDLLDDVKDLLHEDRREPHGWFVKQQHLRPCHQRASDRKHLLLTTRHGSSRLELSLLEAREETKDFLEVVLHVWPWLSQEGTHLKVLAHGHSSKDATPLGAVSNTKANNLMRTQRFNTLSIERDAP